MEEGGTPVVKEDEGLRVFGKVKKCNKEKGFAFIVSSGTGFQSATVLLTRRIGSLRRRR